MVDPHLEHHLWVVPLELERGERELVGASVIYFGQVRW
jgi:hypothetical protein